MSPEQKTAALECLRDLIDKVEAGDVEAVFCVYTDTDGCGMFSCGQQTFELLGVAERLRYCILQSMDS